MKPEENTSNAIWLLKLTGRYKAIKSNDPLGWVCFKRMRNKVNAAIRQAKELFYKNKFSDSDGDPRKTW